MDAWNRSEWHLPSPSSTPTSANFDSSSLQTPKSDGFSTHFLDALATPRPNGHRTPVHTPLQGDAGSSQRPASFHQPRVPSPADPEFHVNHFSPHQHAPLPPVPPARRLASSSGPSSATRSSFDALQGTLAPSHALAASTMDSSQMQTPPPTRDSSSRRKAAAAAGHAIMPSTPSTIASKKFATPSGFAASSPGENFFFQTPMQFPSLQFTPDMANFHNTGPASAPVFPQSRLFWDQGNEMDVDVPASAHPFHTSPQADHPFHGWGSQGVSAPVQPGSFMTSQGPGPPDMNAFWADDQRMDTSNAYGQPGSFVANDSAGVNPSLLFSFSKPPETSADLPTHAPAAGRGPRQPYEHQTQESHREKELARKARQSHSRTSTASSTNSSQSSSKPGLQRSNTDSGFRKQQSASAAQKASGAGGSIPRNASPLKRNSGSGLASIPEAVKPRPKTRLVIDADGRARTETVPTSETRPAEKRRSSHLSTAWYDEDSSSESSEDLPIHSQHGSFAIPPPHRSKHARADSNPDRARPVSFSRPTSSSHGVGSKRISPPKPPGNGQFRRYSTPSVTGAVDDRTATGPDSEMAVEPDDAQVALRKVRDLRIRQQEHRKSIDQLQAHNQRWAHPAADFAKFPAAAPSPPSHTHIQHPAGVFDPFTHNNFALAPLPPTTDRDFPPPPTTTTPSAIQTSSPTTTTALSPDRAAAAAAAATRCVCHGPADAAQPMLQCECCAKWLHARCVGLLAAPRPPVFVCVFCTGSTPVARGGRIREMGFGAGRASGGGGGSGSGGGVVSPLAQRSGGFRR